MTIFTLCLIVSAIMVALGVLIGVKRGFGRALIHFVYLGIFGAVAYFVGHVIADKGAVVLYDLLHTTLNTEIVTLMDTAPHMNELLLSVEVALPLCIAVAAVFAVLALLSLICLKKLSFAILRGITGHEVEEPDKTSRILGGVVGGVTAFLLSLVLLTPFHMVTAVVSDLSDETLALAEESGFGEIADHIRLENPIAEKINHAMILRLAMGKTPEGVKYHAEHEVAVCLNATVAALDAIKAAPTGDAINMLSAGAGAALPVIKDSPFAREFLTYAIDGVGLVLLNDGSIGGLSLHSGNVITDSLVRSFAEVFAATTTDNLAENMYTMFGVDMDGTHAKPTEKPVETTKAPTQEVTPSESTPSTPSKPNTPSTPSESGKPSDTPTTQKPAETTRVPADPSLNLDTQSGAISYITGVDLSNTEVLFQDEQAMSNLIMAIYVISENPNFTPVVETIGTAAGGSLIPGFTKQELEYLHASLLEGVAAEAHYPTARSLKEKIQPIEEMILLVSSTKAHSITPNQAELGAICIVAHFYTPENMANPNLITYEDFAAYFGY